MFDHHQYYYGDPIPGQSCMLEDAEILVRSFSILITWGKTRSSELDPIKFTYFFSTYNRLLEYKV